MAEALRSDDNSCSSGGREHHPEDDNALSIHHTEEYLHQLREAEVTLDPEQSTRLLILMSHAQDCGENHRSPRLTEFCSGVTLAGEPCPFPWCRPSQSLFLPLHPESAALSQADNPSVHSDPPEGPNHSGDQSPSGN